jgi:hypothetical protein
MVQSVAEFRSKQKAIRKKGKRVIKDVIALRKKKRKALRQRSKRAIISERVISPRHEARLEGPSTFGILQMEGDILSTAIYYFDYDPDTLTLIVQFWKVRVKNKRVVSRRPGNKYMYYGVPSEIHSKFVGASSKGRFFYYNIRGLYNFQRLG